MLFSHICPILFYDCFPHKKRGTVCNKDLMYMSLIEMNVLANESVARLMFCLNAQKKPVNSFSVTDKGFLTS